MATTDHVLKRNVPVNVGKIHSVIDLVAEIEHAKRVVFNCLIRRFRVTPEDTEDGMQDASLSLLNVGDSSVTVASPYLLGDSIAPWGRLPNVHVCVDERGVPADALFV